MAATATNDLPDAELVRRAAVGERHAFALLYERHQAKVYRFARMMSGDTAVAEEVTHDVFVTLMQDFHRYDAARATLTTYLYGIARNLTRNRLRRQRRLVAWDQATMIEPNALDDPGARLERHQAVARLRQAIAALPSRYREAVILGALHGLSYAEISAITGAPIGTVRSRLSRGRQLLATRLGADLRYAV